MLGESLQGFFRLGEPILECQPQVAVELFIRDFRDGEKFFRTYVREYASFADTCQSGVLSSKNLFGFAFQLIVQARRMLRHDAYHSPNTRCYPR